MDSKHSVVMRKLWFLSAGRRNFGDFISDYTAPVPAQYVDVDTGGTLGPCVNMLGVTLGQGSRISGLSTRCACPWHPSRREACTMGAS